MTTTIAVVYENGVLRPLQPIDWQEGEEHPVAVQDAAPLVILPANPPDLQRAAETIAEIVALPLEGKDSPFFGRDHDRILYGEPQGAL